MPPLKDASPLLPRIDGYHGTHCIRSGATIKREEVLHCKYLHLQYISTTTLEMNVTSVSGVWLQNIVHYISSTSISCSAYIVQIKYILSVVLYTVKNILPFRESMFTYVKYIFLVMA